MKTFFLLTMAFLGVSAKLLQRDSGCRPVDGYDLYDGLGLSVESCGTEPSLDSCLSRCDEMTECVVFDWYDGDNGCCLFDDWIKIYEYPGTCTYLRQERQQECLEIGGYTLNMTLGSNGAECSDENSIHNCENMCHQYKNCTGFDYDFETSTCCVWKDVPDFDDDQQSCAYFLENSGNSTCKDDAKWRSDFGECPTYQEGGLNHEFCRSDRDEGVPAITACPNACKTCELECDELPGYDLHDYLGRPIDDSCYETDLSTCSDDCLGNSDCVSFDWIQLSGTCCQWDASAPKLTEYPDTCSYAKQRGSAGCQQISGYNTFSSATKAVHEGAGEANTCILDSDGTFFSCLTACENEGDDCAAFIHTFESKECCMWELSPEELPQLEEEVCVYLKKPPQHICNLHVSGFTGAPAQCNGFYYLESTPHNDHAHYTNVETPISIYFFSTFEDWHFDLSKHDNLAYGIANPDDTDMYYLPTDMDWQVWDGESFLHEPRLEISCLDDGVVYPEVICENGKQHCCEVKGACLEGEGHCETNIHCSGTLLCGIDACEHVDGATDCCVLPEKFSCPVMTDFEVRKNFGVPLEKCQQKTIDDCRFDNEQTAETLNSSSSTGFTWFDGQCCIHNEIPKEYEMIEQPGQCTYLPKPTPQRDLPDWVIAVIVIVFTGVVVALTAMLLFYRRRSRRRAEGLSLKVLTRDQFREIKFLASGSFGIAYTAKVHMYDSDTPVLCKIARGQPGQQELNELRILGNLQSYPHPNILRIIGFCANFLTNATPESGTKSANVFELHEGDLQSYVQTKTTLFVMEIYKFALQMTQSVAHLHNHDILHRDVTLQNFVLSSDSEVVLIDFGLARFLSQDNQVYEHKDEDVVQWRICAPEVLLKGYSSKQSTIWQLGIAFWSLLTSQIPFKKFSDEINLLDHLLKVMVHDNRPIPLKFPENVPLEFVELIRSCCSFYESKRPTEAEITDVLEKLISSGSEMQIYYDEECEHSEAKSEDSLSADSSRVLNENNEDDATRREKYKVYLHEKNAHAYKNPKVPMAS